MDGDRQTTSSSATAGSSHTEGIERRLQRAANGSRRADGQRDRGADRVGGGRHHKEEAEKLLSVFHRRASGRPPDSLSTQVPNIGAATRDALSHDKRRLEHYQQQLEIDIKAPVNAMSISPNRTRIVLAGRDGKWATVYTKGSLCHSPR